MNKHKFLVLGLGAVLLFTACKKADLQQATTAAAAATAATAAAATTNSTSANWRSISNWSAQSQDKYTVYSTQVTDSSITSPVASKGLVLVYKRSGNTVTALPYEEKATTGSYFWYYQVASGTLSVIADAYDGAKTPAADQSFKYFVLSADKLATLETQGHTKAELMKLTYENAAAILN
jgi:hypothetical protein